MRCGISLALALLGCASLVQAQPANQPNPPAVPIVAMEDQNEKPRNVASHRGDIVVLIYGDRKSADANKALGERIHVHFHPSAAGQPPSQAQRAPVRPIVDQPAGTRTPDVLAIPVACIGKVPKLVRAVIRNQIRNNSPEVPVWLDFEDVMKSQFPFKESVPNVVVLDAQGRYRYAAAGTPTPQGTSRLLEVIEALRREAVGLK